MFLAHLLPGVNKAEPSSRPIFARPEKHFMLKDVYLPIKFSVLLLLVAGPFAVAIEQGIANQNAIQKVDVEYGLTPVNQPAQSVNFIKPIQKRTGNHF